MFQRKIVGGSGVIKSFTSRGGMGVYPIYASMVKIIITVTDKGNYQSSGLKYILTFLCAISKETLVKPSPCVTCKIFRAQRSKSIDISPCRSSKMSIYLPVDQLRWYFLRN